MANSVFMPAATTAPELVINLSVYDHFTLYVPVCYWLAQHGEVTAITITFAVYNSSPNVNIIKRAKSLVNITLKQ